MYSQYKTILSVFLGFIFVLPCFAQSETTDSNLPRDYLTKEFHASRRQAFRNLMPPNSVAVIFSYPEEVFSKDVDYVYHQNPDLYYFSGYLEPNAVLLIFKDMQPDGDSSYNELFFVQHRDPRLEQWHGKRLGVDGVKSQLGFKRVYNGDEFGKFPLDLKKFTVLSDVLPDTADAGGPGSLSWLVSHFVDKADIKSVDKGLTRDLNLIYTRITIKNLPRILEVLKPKLTQEAYKNDPLIQELMANPDSATLADVKKKYAELHTGSISYTNSLNALRGIKTPEELVLLKRSVGLSSIAHAEAMKAVNPKMSERELEGIMLYVHKKYGAEEEGYPPIIGAGGNGCILHYEENNAMELKNQLVLMDVGAMYHGYSADVTRTFPANGKFTEEQKAIYQLVYEAQEVAFKICKQGITFDSLEAATTEVLAAGMIKLGLIKTAKEVKIYYPHGMTHHLGLDVHDKGVYDSLRENMVITVEPGIYIPAGSKVDQKWWNIGVRIEDDVVVGKNGCTLLSGDAPRQWQDVEKKIAEKSMFDGVNLPILK